MNRCERDITRLVRALSPSASGMEAPSGGETEGLDPKDESPVGEAETPK